VPESERSERMVVEAKENPLEMLVTSLDVFLTEHFPRPQLPPH